MKYELAGMNRRLFKMKKLFGCILVVLLFTPVVFITGCSGVKISDVLDNPGDYEGKEVSVSGTVTERYWIDILGMKGGAYQIDDGSGKIWIITSKEPPAEGEKASTKGVVATAGKIGDRSFGTVINETVEE
jgi:hypothetical protein